MLKSFFSSAGWEDEDQPFWYSQITSLIWTTCQSEPYMIYTNPAHNTFESFFCDASVLKIDRNDDENLVWSVVSSSWTLVQLRSCSFLPNRWVGLVCIFATTSPPLVHHMARIIDLRQNMVSVLRIDDFMMNNLRLLYNFLWN